MYCTHYATAYPQPMIDIYSCSAQVPKNKKHGGSRKKKAIVITAVSLLTAAALACGGWLLLNPFGAQAPAPGSAAVFAANTTVSGLDVSGMTYDEARAFLLAHEDALITPVTLTVQVGDNAETLTQDNFAYSLNLDSALNAAGGDAHTAAVTATPDADSVSDAANAIADKYTVAPQDASVAAFRPFAEERFELTESRDGFTVNAADLSQKITAALNGGPTLISAETETVPAAVTTDALRGSLVQLGSCQTKTTTDTENRANATHNMAVALDACNQNNEILPGEIWSFNACTGDSNLESNGYVASTVIVNGQYVDGVGGGICQASSTIYGAAVRANLKIAERTAHKWASSYVPTGLDATIDYGNLDLKLQNTSDTPVYLECRLEDNTLTAAFWGVKSAQYDEIVVRNQDGADDGDGEGYSVTAWREYYKDGAMVDEEALPSSHYDMDASHGHSFQAAD